MSLFVMQLNLESSVFDESLLTYFHKYILHFKQVSEHYFVGKKLF